ncbi:unnamed protein product [Arabidopsis halleri]
MSWIVREGEYSVQTCGSSEGNEDQVIAEEVQVLNNTPEKSDETSLSQERGVKRENELKNDETIQESEKAAIQRFTSVFTAALGNYTIWDKEYRRVKNFEDILRLMQNMISKARVQASIAKMKYSQALHKELETQLVKNSLASEEESTDVDVQQRVLDTVRDMDQMVATMTTKLRGILQVTREELAYIKACIEFLSLLASRTLPDAIHCLTMRLTLEYYLLPAPMRNFPRRENLENPNRYHYALFSDNVLAASVVVNSTVMNAQDPSRHVFHLVTDKLNVGAMSMWFLLNPPGEATIHVQPFEDFAWFNSSYSPVLRQLESTIRKHLYFTTERSESVEPGSENLRYRYPNYKSMLKLLRFYIPIIFPKLEKILLLDDDVVVQKDLTPLWSIDLKGKVNGAVETCGVTFHRLDTYLNFSDQHISENFDPKACGWAYGMNIFDLKEWKKNNITETYHFWQKLNENQTLWELETLPAGLIMFYNLTLPLESKWHLLGLGYDKEIDEKDIENSAVIHFNGPLKPWKELGVTKYQPYWTRYINFDHPYLFSCRLFQ